MGLSVGRGALRRLGVGHVIVRKASRAFAIFGATIAILVVIKVIPLVFLVLSQITIIILIDASIIARLAF